MFGADATAEPEREERDGDEQDSDTAGDAGRKIRIVPVKMRMGVVECGRTWTDVTEIDVDGCLDAGSEMDWTVYPRSSAAETSSSDDPKCCAL